MTDPSRQVVQLSWRGLSHYDVNQFLNEKRFFGWIDFTILLADYNFLYSAKTPKSAC